MRVRLPLPAPFHWSAKLAYVLGLITTDGNLCADKRHIQFTTTDFQLVKEFKNCLNLKNKISTTSPTGFGIKTVYRINFGNIKLYNWLESIGLTPKKTHTLEKIFIPKRFFADFLRGHLDGDGSIFTYIDKYLSYKGKRYIYYRLCTVFNSGSFKHIKWLRKKIYNIIGIKGSLSSYIPKNRRIPLWKLKYSKNESLILLQWLYYKDNAPHLKRKRKVINRFLKYSNKSQ